CLCWWGWFTCPWPGASASPRNCDREGAHRGAEPESARQKRALLLCSRNGAPATVASTRRSTEITKERECPPNNTLTTSPSSAADRPWPDPHDSDDGEGVFHDRDCFVRVEVEPRTGRAGNGQEWVVAVPRSRLVRVARAINAPSTAKAPIRSEEHTSELQ